MERTDFIENRIDVVKNIYTLYAYAKSDIAEDKEWALERFKRGKWFVVEPFGNTLLFAPSRFVGYKNNTIEKHTKKTRRWYTNQFQVSRIKIVQRISR